MPKFSRAKNEFVSVRPCGRDLYELVPRRAMKVELNSASAALSESGYRIDEISDMVLTLSGPHSLSLYPNGKMLVFPARTNEEAECIGEMLLQMLRSSGAISE